MSYLVLARKYRPKNFSEMVGQPHVVQALSNALLTQKLHHAYLFTGTRGVGKTTVSRILAKSLNCLGAEGQGAITATPCGVCQACVDIDSGRFVDYTELDAASNRGVDEMAQLLEQAVYKPVLGRFKVFMIDEVHMLSNAAFNSMLKTLEEPPPYLKFVLATTDPQKVPATVLSRCLQFNLRPMPAQTIVRHLIQVLQAEGVAAQPQALRLLAQAARGSMRDALSLTDQAIAFSQNQFDESSVRSMLGSVDRSHVFGLLDALAQGNGKTVVHICEQLRVHGLSAASTLEEMLAVLQRMAVLQVAGLAALAGNDGDEDDADPHQHEVARLAQVLPVDETQLLYSLCLQGQGELGLAPDEYAALTMVLLRLLAFKPRTAVATVQADASHSVGVSLARDCPPATELVNSESRARPVPANTPAHHVESPDQDKKQAVAIVQVNSVAAIKIADPVIVVPPLADAGPASQAFNDVWSRLVNRLVALDAINAMTRELALQSQLRERRDGVWTLQVERASLNQPTSIDKLQAALQAAELDQPLVQLQVQVGPVADTPAQRNAAELAARQLQAEKIITQDPLVQELIEKWDGKIVPGSIKPVASKPA